MNDGFVRCGSAVPDIKVADCAFNAEKIIEKVREAAENSCSVLVFPELCITGYTCGDLFLSETLKNGAAAALKTILAATAELDILFIVGLPVPHLNRLYNCAAVCCKGRLLGLVPKRNIPNYSEFYEARHFSRWEMGRDENDCVNIDMGLGYTVPMGELIFSCQNFPQLMIAAEICEDLWVPDPPSVTLSEGGAVIICNPSASDEVIGKKEYRRDLVRMQSARLVGGYIYTDCGFGESTQDMVFSGHCLICENGSILSEKRTFSGSGIIYADLDLERLASERRKMTTYGNSAEYKLPLITFSMDIPENKEIKRFYAPMPFVPADKADLSARCEEILTMQATGLATRLRHIGCKTCVIGLSGGLDSTLALIVTVHAFDMLSLDRKGIIAVTMPCFGTTKRTKSNALILAEAYGASIREIDITKSVRQHFEDIGQEESVHDITYENCQARERTQVIMDIANKSGGIVIGTGDLSELALGWATYNGDHMSMYGVNAGVPKTLVRHLVHYEADIAASDALRTVLLDILDTPVSPELLPAKDGEIAQKTEDLVGPYELHDFYLYQVLRFGFGPAKIFRLAKAAFAGRAEYPDEVLYKWLRNFYWRFFAQQFKRSCLPDGPKVGSVTLSPRGDWRMPSDACAALWLAELEQLSIKD